MKVKSNLTDAGYQPINLTITLESEEEAQGFYAVFNYTPINDFLRSKKLDPDKIREVLNKHNIQAGIAELDKRLESCFK